MAKKLDRILIVDVESTCWEDEPPRGEQSEIIEIGICSVDTISRRRVEAVSILVKPESSRVSAYCQELTTLTQKQVDEGVSFKEACSILRTTYSSKDRVWASYGDYDRRQFERQCRSFGVGYPFGPTHINVKNLFAIINALPHEIGMSEALQFLGLPLEGVHHRANDDAWNISLILIELLKKRNLVSSNE